MNVPVAAAAHIPVVDSSGSATYTTAQMGTAVFGSCFHNILASLPEPLRDAYAAVSVPAGEIMEAAPAQV